MAPPPAHAAPTVADVIKKFRELHIPTLAKSSEDAAEWILGQHIEPKWS